MGKLTLEQEINRTPEIPDHYIEGEPEAYMDGWKAGMREWAKWQKEQYKPIKQALEIGKQYIELYMKKMGQNTTSTPEPNSHLGKVIKALEHLQD